jgi:hypothetical protein
MKASRRRVPKEETVAAALRPASSLASPATVIVGMRLGRRL